jgi:uncharacterized cupin superfamily protein
VPNGHHLVNRGDEDCIFIAVGKVAATDCHYPDIDLLLDSAAAASSTRIAALIEGRPRNSRSPRVLPARPRSIRASRDG